MSDKEYIKNKGLKCPSCRSGDITTLNKEMEDDGFYVSTECEKCGASWKEHYRLSGYTDFETVH